MSRANNGWNNNENNDDDENSDGRNEDGDDARYYYDDQGESQEDSQCSGPLGYDAPTDWHLTGDLRRWWNQSRRLSDQSGGQFANTEAPTAPLGAEPPEWVGQPQRPPRLRPGSRPLDQTGAHQAGQAGEEDAQAPQQRDPQPRLRPEIIQRFLRGRGFGFGFTPPLSSAPPQHQQPQQQQPERQPYQQEPQERPWHSVDMSPELPSLRPRIQAVPNATPHTAPRGSPHMATRATQPFTAAEREEAARINAAALGTRLTQIAVQERPLLSQAAHLPPLPLLPSQPFSLTRHVAASFFLCLDDGSLLPPNILAAMSQHQRRIWLSPLLFPEEDRYALLHGEVFSHFARLEAAIERTPAVRWLLAALWARWYCARDCIAEATQRDPRDLDLEQMPAQYPWHPAHIVVAAFLPISGGGPYVVRKWHCAYYTHLIRQTNRLLCDHRMLDKRTAQYLGLPRDRSGELSVAPERGAAREQAVLRHALTYLGTVQQGPRTPDEVMAKAWQQYVNAVASELAVPYWVAQDRLSGDRSRVSSAADLSLFTDQILAGNHHLAHLRGHCATRFHVRGMQQKQGDYHTAAQQVALFCAESLPDVPLLDY